MGSISLQTHHLQCLEVDGMQCPPPLILVLALLALTEPYYDHAQGDDRANDGRSNPWNPVTWM